MARQRASRTVSDRTLRLLEEIHRSRSARFGSPEAASLVERAASCREPRAVLYLRELFLDRRRIWVDAASRSIMELLECLGAADMLWFDDLMRHGWLARRAFPG